MDHDDMEKEGSGLTRREMLTILGSAGAAIVVGGSGAAQEAAASQLSEVAQLPQGAKVLEAAQATRQQVMGCVLTLARTEGPYYTPGSPQRTTLVEAGMVGARVLLTGYVYNTSCTPIANAWLDFWEANYYGQYDNVGYTLRGHTYSDANGRYQMETIVPGEYPGRTIHIHVKVQAPGGPILTTQVFFPDVAHNASDGIFHPSLVVALENVQGVKTATFNYVVPTAEGSPKPSSGGRSHTFRETGFTVSGRFWDVWRGGHSFEESIFINGYPISPVRNEVSLNDGKVYPTQWFERARFELHEGKQAPDDVVLTLLGVTATQGRENEEPFRRIPNPGGRSQWFARTGHTLGDESKGGQAIIDFWSQKGDVRQFGLPISQPFMEARVGDSASYLVQYFERQRFEYHPENNGTRFEIVLGRLGSEQVKRKI